PAQIAGRNRVWRKMAIDDLNRGDLAGAIHLLMIAGSAPLQWQKGEPTRDDADRWLAEQMKTRMASTNVDDLLYALEASRNYDPSADLEKIKAPLLAINSADDFVNPPELGIMENLMPRVAHGRYVLIPTSEKTRGHGTHTWPEVWGSELEKFLRNAGGPPAVPPAARRQGFSRDGRRRAGGAPAGEAAGVTVRTAGRH